MQWMKRKQGRYECAFPHGCGHPVQHEEKQKCVGMMKEQARQMMPTGFEVKEATVDHVGHPGQWMPVARVECLESPNDAPPAHTSRHNWIFSYVFRIIIV